MRRGLVRAAVSSNVMQGARPTLPFFDTHTHTHYAMRELQLGEDWAAYSGAVDAAQQPSKKNTALAAFAVHLEGAVNVWCETAELLPGQTEEHGRILAHEGVWGAFGLHPHNAK